MRKSHNMKNMTKKSYNMKNMTKKAHNMKNMTKKAHNISNMIDLQRRDPTISDPTTCNNSMNKTCYMYMYNK